MAQCRICDSVYSEFIDFGMMPIANGFLAPEMFNDEFFYPLKVGFCDKCAMVQLIEQPDREMMFHDNYAYFSSTSERMTTHFRSFAESVMSMYLGMEDPFVVELGSNDGIMLQNFVAAGIRHLGIEPSANVAQSAMDKGIETICCFFDQEIAEKIFKERGPANAIIAANLMCHIPYLHSVVEGVCRLLSPGGVMIFEDPYLGDIIDNTSYDQIYDEHVFFFSVSSIQYLFNMHGMEVIDVIPQDVHGGSMRYVISHKGDREVSPRVATLIQEEQSRGLNKRETFESFRRKVELSREQLLALLHKVRKEGKRVVGYGATSKSTTVNVYCGITSDLVEFVSDTTPTKQGRYSPGAHIPVRPYEDFKERYPDYALLFAWNHAREIMAKETLFREAGGKWIVYVPEVKVLE